MVLEEGVRAAKDNSRLCAVSGDGGGDDFSFYFALPGEVHKESAV